jgi:hypothetical protein
MGARGLERVAACIALALAVAGSSAVAAPLSDDEFAAACAGADGPEGCARRIEEIQLKRLPNLATRTGDTLKVSLYPSGVVDFADTVTLRGGRTYALWDFMSEINAVVLFVTNDGNSSFEVLQRANGRRYELPAEPKLSPDRTRLVTADFCASSCVNELAVWRVTRDGVQKELVWKPARPWTDAGVKWKNPDTLVVEYTAADAKSDATLERRLTDPSWQRVDPP